MTDLLGRFSSLSMVGKALVLLVVAAVIVPLAFIFRGGAALWVVLGGLVLVLLLLAGMQAVLRAKSRKQASPFEKALTQAGAATPMGISEPARRARLDDLRKSFDSGLDKFKAAGKNLYSLPWYLVVGEPGSGKTEAIRHCNVGFPPGLQDELQGSGGTLNMNWWFTNHAVLIDTAGRLMFEEVEAGSTSEWTEFLKLLKRYRPNCPMNGMLLVIPAESLIKDTADAIQSKAARIAKQLDTVQRTLGVRFPVFVVITKADLINGFREFFDMIKEPQLQHQMLGWSNPEELDTPFNPDRVDEHLREVNARLARRRLGLLLDPVHTEDPKGRRTDQVDALFAFPESMQKLGPRLRQYLSLIFVQGEWSAKPLFLRGIYFTSSMREGSALDADLAEALGLPLGQLPEGRVWERDRAFFLRDLFMSKVFRERGLVTRVLNTARLRRARALAVLGTAAAGVIFLAGLTWFGAKSLSTAILDPLAFWTSAAQAYSSAQVPVDPDLGADRHLLPIVQKQLAGEEFFRYRGDAPDSAELKTIGVDAALQRRATFPKALRSAAETPIRVPTVFKPVAILAGDKGSDLLVTERAQAARALIRASVAVPLLDASRTRLRGNADGFESDAGWSPEATAALMEIARLYTHPRTGVPADFAGSAPKLEPLLKYALTGTSDFADDRVGDDLVGLQDSVEWVFAHDNPSVVVSSLRRDAADLRLLEEGVVAYAESVRSSMTGGASAADRPAGSGPASRLVANLQALESALAKLSAMASTSGDGAAERIAAEWSALYTQAETAGKAAGELVGSVQGSLARAVADERGQAATSFERDAVALQALLGQAALNASEPGSPMANKFLAIKGELEREMGKLREVAQTAAVAAVPESVTSLERRFLGTSPSGLELTMATLARLDERVKLVVKADDAPSDAAQARDMQRTVAEQSERVQVAQRALAQRWSEDPLATMAAEMLRMLDTSDRRALASATLAEAPTSATSIARTVGERANATTGRPAFPAMPLAAAGSVSFDPRFHAQSASQVLRPIFELRSVSTDEPEALRKRALAIDAAGEYVRQFAAYWSRTVIEQSLPDAAGSWSDTHRAASGAPDAWMHHGPLKTLVQTARQSAKLLSDDLRGLLDTEELRVLDRIDRAADRAMTTLDDAGFERAVQTRLGAWRGLGADAAAAASAMAKTLADPSRASDWFLTIPGRAGEADLAQAYWRGLFIRMSESLRGSTKSQAKPGLALMRELAFPLTSLDATGPAGELGQEDVDRLASRLASVLAEAGAAGGGNAPATLRGFSPDAEIDAHAAALADSSVLSASEIAKLSDALAVARWCAGEGGGSGGGANARVEAGAVQLVLPNGLIADGAAPTASVSAEPDLIRVSVTDAAGTAIGERSFAGAWPALRMLARAGDSPSVQPDGAYRCVVDVSRGTGGQARVTLTVRFQSAPASTTFLRVPAP